MMAERRKSLSKKIRFEVFKRDKFTCQYCGRSAPDVILEADHIKPVAEGGKDDLLNLITSCRDCNRGKGKTRIFDSSEIKKQQDQMKELAEKRDQMKMLLEWRSELENFEDEQAEAVSKRVKEYSDRELSDVGKREIIKLIHRFSFVEVLEAVDISFDRYYRGTTQSLSDSLYKIGGVCYNRRKQREENGEV